MREQIFLFVFAIIFTNSSCKNIFAINSYSEAEADELVSVVVLYRHGDRSPISSYPTDPYIDSSYWPEGYGQLLNKGKERQYQLGEWFRKRYSTFLPNEYSPKDIRVVSTDVDRTLMSAAANLAGLYPPTKSEIWDEDLGTLWEPIPIHTKPKNEDEILAMEKDCPKYNEFEEEASSSEFFKNMTVTYADFFEYVTNHTGRNTTTLGNIVNLYSVFYVYRNHNASYIPDWGNSLDNETLAYLAGVHFTHSTLTDELKRLHTGPFFYYLTEYFDGIIGNTTDTPKFLMLSGHDTTIASVLNSMGAYDNWPPEFSSTVIWELYRANNETYYVNLLYKRNNDSDVEELVISGCKFDCDYDDFMAALEPYTVEYSIWEEECIPSDGSTYKSSLSVLFALLILSFLMD